MIPYEFVDRLGTRLVTDWQLEDFQRRQLRGLLITLEGTDRNQAVGSVIFKIGGQHLRKGKTVRKLYYAKINGKVALRPRCYIGPKDGELVTFLERVVKSGGVESPGLNESKAPERMAEIAENPNASRRITFHREGGNE